MTLTVGHEFSSEEINLIEKHDLTVADVRDVLGRFPEQELDTAIGLAVVLKKGHKPAIESVTDTVTDEEARPQEKSSDSEEKAT